MSLLFLDGFDLGDSNASGKWNVFNSVGIASSGGIHGFYALFNDSADRAQKVLAAGADTTFIAHLYLQASAGGNDGVANMGVIRFQGDGGATAHLNLSYTSTQALRVRLGGGTGAILGTSAAVLTVGNWHHIGFKAFLSDTVGTVDVWVDGVNVLSLTGQDTRNGGTVVAFDAIELPGANGGPNPDFIDDLIILNGVDSGIAGMPNNDFLGVCRVESLLPDADTATEQWTLSAGSDSFALVDEVPPNGNTDYIEHDVAGEKTQLGLGDLVSSAVDILGVQLSSHAVKMDAGTALFRQGIRSDASDANGADHALTESYINYQDIFEADPDGGGAWTPAQLNAAEAFVEVRT
jgi:hypothetical protein